MQHAFNMQTRFKQTIREIIFLFTFVITQKNCKILQQLVCFKLKTYSQDLSEDEVGKTFCFLSANYMSKLVNLYL